jgi:hypothetical protein
MDEVLNNILCPRMMREMIWQSTLGYNDRERQGVPGGQLYGIEK